MAVSGGNRFARRSAKERPTIHVKRVGELAIEEPNPPPRLVKGPIEVLAFWNYVILYRTEALRAAEEFWSQHPGTRCGPLIRADQGATIQSYLVTFLWRGSEQTRSVLLLRGAV